MLKKVAMSLFVSLMVAGTSIAAQENPVEDKGLQHAEGQTHEAKDPLQFGPLKVSLDAMLRGDSTNNFNFADFTFTPENSDDRLLVRVRPSLTLTPNDYLTAKVEGQWYATYNHNDFDKVRLYQGYLEGSLPGKKAILRAGLHARRRYLFRRSQLRCG